MANSKIEKRIKRKKRITAKAQGTDVKPRLSVFRSNAHIYAQLIDDNARKTILTVSDLKLKGSKTETAKLVGNEVAKKAIKAGVKEVVFDRNGYKYHGRVAAVAQGARDGGLNF